MNAVVPLTRFLHRREIVRCSSLSAIGVRQGGAMGTTCSQEGYGAISRPCRKRVGGTTAFIGTIPLLFR